MEYRLSDIHADAILGKNVTVESFVTIQPDVIIDDNTWIGSHVTIMSGSRIGKNCQIFPNAVIGAATQDKKKACQQTYVEIGDNTVIREFVTLNRGTVGNTTIGSHVLLMAYVHVAHDCIIEDHVVVANATQLAGHVVLQHHAVIGGMAAIHQFIHVGAYSMVGSKSIVRKDIPPFTKVAHEPLRYCGINFIGLQRHGFNQEQCDAIRDSYRYIYQSKMPLASALEMIDKQIENSQEKNVIIDFIRNSNAGIVKKTDRNAQFL
ncbi:acyl-ACP--UDP-N-acetylglucosamine O-acyltransferase [Cardinium endosymbiont of Culicoides punctatus]|uniref:acyl-ACP--UDP-N-acetylglucosamine O-acyltransferase n=1 Tax=Cardinium endosymbiont of Culicoides punctatus TaxID=2304601 RepID=UPI00105874D1|nr:acyl-ACP--UDP-N-acetylglucosamine O-acyltransferase [Cardinium endosymbiont of Culicoides punctatus]TDG95785.1 Acyl-[acyl-carrier-protein]--UDP-N-acetylglucosamine O-acyltransferase [Cardinium endosymbiont of Culicoides punctatus]